MSGCAQTRGPCPVVSGALTWYRLAAVAWTLSTGGSFLYNASVSSRKTHEMTARDARVRLRDAMDYVRAGTDVLITRWNRVEAVMVHPDWYAEAVKLMSAKKHDE